MSEKENGGVSLSLSTKFIIARPRDYAKLARSSGAHEFGKSSEFPERTAERRSEHLHFLFTPENTFLKTFPHVISLSVGYEGKHFSFHSEQNFTLHSLKPDLRAHREFLLKMACAKSTPHSISPRSHLQNFARKRHSNRHRNLYDIHVHQM